MSLDDLLRRVRDREPRSLHTLMEEHGPHVFSLALRITGSETDAEDLVREVFLDLPDALGRFDGHDFRTWLTTLATQRAYRHVRSTNDSSGDASPPGIAARRTAAGRTASGRTGSAARANVHGGVVRDDLESAIEGLADDHRVVFLLKEVEGLSHDEVATALGISPGLSRVRLHQARKALIEHFQAANLGMKHPTQFMMSRFVDHDLPPGTSEPIDEHLEVCTSCRQYVAWLRDLQHVARTLRQPRPIPPRITDDLIRRRHERNGSA